MSSNTFFILTKYIMEILSKLFYREFIARKLGKDCSWLHIYIWQFIS